MKWRVNFYYTSHGKMQEFWKEAGKSWNKHVESFMGRKNGVAEAVAKLVSSGDGAEPPGRRIAVTIAKYLRTAAAESVPGPDVGFASYQSKVEVEGTKIRYWREYVVRDLSVNADHIADWRKLQGVIGSDEASAVVLRRTP